MIENKTIYDKYITISRPFPLFSLASIFDFGGYFQNHISYYDSLCDDYLALKSDSHVVAEDFRNVLNDENLLETILNE